MHRPALIAFTALALTACGQGQDTAPAPAAEPAAPAPSAAPAPPAPIAAEKATLLAALPAPYNAADLDNGRRAFARCRSCHTIAEGGANMTGPNLYGLFGRDPIAMKVDDMRVALRRHEAASLTVRFESVVECDAALAPDQAAA